MAGNPSSSRTRPQIYVHFEFGVSWSQRQPPRPHAVTYMSRNMRERSPHFPRQLPPPTTNFLAAPIHHQPSSSRAAAAPQPEPQREDQPRQRRHSRQSSRSSHERGSSAPPPFSDSPWDADPEPLSASVLPPRSSGYDQAHHQHQAWKELPAEPSQYRLGDDGMPWSAWSWPGYHDGEGGGAADHQHHNNAAATYGSNAAGPSTSSHERTRNHDGDGRRRELEALSAAMMTIDNGFEDQWWFQGPRQNVAGDLHTGIIATQTQPIATQAQPAMATGPGSVGWAIASDEPRGEGSPAVAMRDLVSPVTEFGTPVMSDHGSPPPSYSPPNFGRLNRSLTTRSEELFMPM